MAFNLEEVQAPTFEPVDVEVDVKPHLHILFIDDDDYLGNLVKAARFYIEKTTNLSVVDREYKWHLDEDALRWLYKLPRAPVRSVVSIDYLDDNETPQTVSSSLYEEKLYRDPPQVQFKDNAEFPSNTNDVTINFEAGYADQNSVPQIIKQAHLFLIDHWYHHREAASEINYRSVPRGFEAILRSLKQTRWR